ncbi:hypothetical protein G7Z17_g4579 [Cylindrodendrum hubeiense]|uniref:Uncharacterized protein n=1 Tax=Cylindrodendrum hubeiense TaxID=595255 RepID=A0A9P5H8M3_9HYPO|nr:hypothetical protein G7Z17_g4579 [Cylindrodendrum hubeiense]
MTAPVWLITGTSNGLGLLLSLRVLAAGHKVIGTVRDMERSAEAVRSIEQAGGYVIQLDMTESQENIIQKVQAAEKKIGNIDFLVNNAGYSLLGPIEFFTEKQAETQIRTNLFGPLYAIQAVLPGMRARQSGTIINISSVAGQDGQPSCGLYAASKFSLEGLSEALAKEMKEFGISVLIVEPGAFRTNFLNASIINVDSIDKGYEGTAVDGVVKKFEAFDGKQPGDPHKAVNAIFEVATGEGAAGCGEVEALASMPGGPAFICVIIRYARINHVSQF